MTFTDLCGFEMRITDRDSSSLNSGIERVRPYGNALDLKSRTKEPEIAVFCSPIWVMARSWQDLLPMPLGPHNARFNYCLTVFDASLAARPVACSNGKLLSESFN